MAKPLSELPSILERRHQQFLNGVNRVSRQAAAKAGEAAVRGTRVDTGLARSNWGATLAVPATAVIPPYAPGFKLGIGEQGNAIGALAQHRSLLGLWNAAKGTVFFITNNVPYISILNFGGPNVSPGNMLALARQAWKAELKRISGILK